MLDFQPMIFMQSDYYKEKMSFKFQIIGILLVLFLGIFVLEFPWLIDFLAYSFIALSEIVCEDSKILNPHSYYLEGVLLALS